MEINIYKKIREMKKYFFENRLFVPKCFSIKNSKKAFAFSFLAFFIVIVIFAFVSLTSTDKSQSDANNFEQSRILFIDDELKYFKDSYVKSAIKYSLYSTLDALMNYSRDGVNYASINQNYTRFNELLYEGLLNGTFNGVDQDLLINIDNKNKTLTWFLDLFERDFERFYNVNFTFDILAFNVYETQTYYVTAEVLVKYNVTMDDNLSDWNFFERFDVRVPVYDLYEPEYLLMEDYNISIKSSEYELESQNWTIKFFNESLANGYSSVFFEPIYKYSIGTSFLNRFLNISRSSYGGVLGFWSFDYDLEEEGVYDTADNSVLGRHYGNTRFAMSFDSEKVNMTTQVAFDSTAYESNGVLMNGVDCSYLGIFNRCCYFDGVNDYINISKNDLNLNTTNQITISAWIFPTANYDVLSGKESEIFRYGAGFVDVIDLRLTQGNKLQMEIGSHNGGVFYQFNSTTNITLNKWTHILGMFDGDTGVGKVYLNNVLDNLDADGNFEISSPIDNFTKSNIDIGIGNTLSPALDEKFAGSIDELAVYSKILDDEEIAQIYKNRKIQMIDYKDTLHEVGIEFDGIDDYINLTSSLNVDMFYDDWSVEVWFESYNNTGTHMLINKHHPFYIQIFDGTIKIGAFTTPGGWRVLTESIEENKTYQVISMWNATSKSLSLYLNGKYINKLNTGNDIASPINNNIYIGASYYAGIQMKNYFNGIIDEVKIYNRTLSEDEITQSYYNYKSFEQGCCNYITLINPNKFDYNTSTYDNNVSYSSKVFYDHYLRGKSNIIRLHNITNITSYDYDKFYFNFLVDACLIDSYNMYSYQNESIDVQAINSLETSGLNCSDLIKQGIY